MALTRPICKTATAFRPVTTQASGMLVDQSNQYSRKYADVLVPALVEDRDRGEHYAICECQECGRLYIAAKQYGYFGDWRAAYPLPIREIVGEAPEDVRHAFEDALKCLAVEAYGGCLLMCRTTIIRLLRDKKAAGLKELLDKEVISGMLYGHYGQSDEVRLWANMIGHEDFSLESVTPEAVEELIGYVEALLDATYAEPLRLQGLKQKTARSRTQG